MRRKIRHRNRICAALLVFTLAGALTAGAVSVPSVYAKTEAEKKRDEYKKKLKDKNKDIENIKEIFSYFDKDVIQREIIELIFIILYLRY